MKAEHLEFLVEEPSMEAFLNELLPKLPESKVTYTIHAHQGKSDLLLKLPSRLRGYSKWIPESARIVVLVDRDNDDCLGLKQQLECAADSAGLRTRSQARGMTWQVVNRIAIEELEAWFFGNWDALRDAYPRVSSRHKNKAQYRYSDSIAGGTWEAMERILQSAGYFSGGLRKMEFARTVGANFDPASCISPSFMAFLAAIGEATQQDRMSVA